MARRRPSRSRLALRWLGPLLLVFIALAYVRPLESYRDAQDEVAKRKATIARLERGNAALTKRLSRTGKNEFVEREARRLGLVRPGERLFIVKGVEHWTGRRLR